MFKMSLLAILVLFQTQAVSVFANDEGNDLPEFEAQANNSDEDKDKDKDKDKDADNAAAADNKANENTEKKAAPVAATPSDNAERETMVFNRLRELVKKLDNFGRRNAEFPVKAIESAIRGIFVKGTEGSGIITWGNKRLSETDMNLAYDNLELFITYSENLAKLSVKKPKAKAKDLADMKLQAAKMVVDQCNSSKKQQRMVASFMERPKSFTQFGKNETRRRKALLGGLVAGDDYTGLATNKMDDLGKAYKNALNGSCNEYEKFARAMIGGGNAGGNAHKGGAAKAKTGKKKS